MWMHVPDTALVSNSRRNTSLPHPCETRPSDYALADPHPAARTALLTSQLPSLIRSLLTSINSPLVEACQISTLAFFNGSPLTASVTVPCMSAILPSSGSFSTTVSPFFRTGVSWRQKGPKIADGVADPAEAAACLYVISSTSLVVEMISKIPQWSAKNGVV